LFAELWDCSIHLKTVACGDTKCFTCVEEDGALRWADNITLAADDEGEEANKEEAEGKEVRCPEVDLKLHPDGRDRGERPDVDTPVEDVVQALDGDVGINNHPLTAWEDLESGLGASVLFGDQGRDVGLDTTGPETQDDHASDQAAQASAVI